MRKGFGTQRQSLPPLIHILGSKIRASSGLILPQCKVRAGLLRASLMLVAIGGAAFAGPLEDAVAAYQRGDYATALRLWHPLAEQGGANAQFRLGVMYDSGHGMLRSDAEAIKWYRKAAEQDDAVAQFDLGVMYAKGVSPNHGEAALWSWFSWRPVQPRNDVCRGPGRAPRRCASACVAEPGSHAATSFG